MSALADDAAVIDRIFDHLDHRTTDRGTETWREPVEHYRSPDRFAAERDHVLRRYPVAFCPSAALPEAGSYVARTAAGVPLLVVRGADGVARGFRNACRHRGTQLVDGAGCARAFACRYHGWTYTLDGRLTHVPHEDGFPGLEKATHGLVPVATAERQGVVFVTQDAPLVDDAALDALPPLLPPRARVLTSAELEAPVNWKVIVQGFLEGYHIRATHPQTFYPVQYDNLNVVERFGRNARVTFPYRAIEKLRTRARDRWSIHGKLTYVYHLFPNVMISTFPANVFLTVLEPRAVDRTAYVTWVLTEGAAGDEQARASSTRSGDFVQAGAAEDVAVAQAIQRGLASGANDAFVFGHFEAAIVHFHRNLGALLAAGTR